MFVTVQVKPGYRYTLSDKLYVMQCSECGIVHGVPDDFDNRRRDDGRTFYCPNGHSQVYRETEEDRLQRKIKRLEEENRWQDDQRRAAEADAKRQRRVAAAARGRLTKIKNRIAAGVCPVPGCKRSGLGTDVVAHIESCHPTWHHHEEAE